MAVMRPYNFPPPFRLKRLVFRPCTQTAISLFLTHYCLYLTILKSGDVMAEEQIKCPHCGKTVELSQALTKDIETRLRGDFESQAEKTRKHFECEIEKREEAFRGRLEENRRQLEEKVRKQAADEVRLELTEAREALEQKERRLAESEKKELELRREKRALEEREKMLELEMTRRLDSERHKIEEQMALTYEESHRLKEKEKDQQIESMRKTIDELKRKAEQGSQQTQGEVLETELEENLRAEFPFDKIEPVAKGKSGGDILQTVFTQSGRECGKIIWETKRTKTWQQGWIQKLKDDLREAKASLAVLVSETLPAGFHHFREVDGVWVTDIPSALSLALALRMNLIQVERAREFQAGRREKMEVLYDYVTGPEFKNRVQAVLETFVSLKSELEHEKTAMQRIWDKREKQFRRVASNMAGLYGDIEGLTGLALPSVKILELPAGED